MKFTIAFVGLAAAIKLDPPSEWYQADDDGVTPLGGE